MKIINEVSRKNIIGKTKVQSPARYNRRLRYSTMSTPEIDEDKLIKADMLVISVKVGNYMCQLAYSGVIEHLIENVKKDARHSLNRKAVIRAMNEQVDLVDIFVSCTCADFKYRYAYYATRHDYLYGTPETRPAQITNPHDDIGAVCKHLACILANKKWLVKASSVVNDILHDRYSEVIENYNVSAEEFQFDEQKYNAASINAIKQSLTRLPAELQGASNRLYDADNLELQLFNLLDNRGWYISVDEDLDSPNYVRVSKDANALESGEGDVFTFEVVPAGTKIRLKRVETLSENY